MLIGSVTHPDEIDSVGDVDGIELRFDHFSFAKRPSLLPTIFTLRKKEQGGRFAGTEEERLAKMEELLRQEPAYLDIEVDTDPRWIEKISERFPKTRLIGSLHNFQETPRDLHALFRSMKNPHFSLYKMALMAHSTLDMLRLLVFAKEIQEPLSVISMGEYGKPSRVLGPVLGNGLNYAGVDEDKQLGRYSLSTLHKQFRYRSLNEQTKIYALVGDPVSQSPGDRFHNAHFTHNAVYVKMRLTPSEVPEFFSLVSKLPFGGLSVTMPLKEIVASHMDRIDPAAEAIGAINTVTFSKGKGFGSNTDAPGALNAIEKHLSVRGKRLAILGAGGSARAIAYEAKQRGAQVILFNRTFSRCQSLAHTWGVEAYPLEAFGQASYDLLVNTIPDLSPPSLLPNKVVMDLVYEPEETPLLKKARQTGSLCIYGKEMFFEQAVLQQSQWELLKN